MRVSRVQAFCISACLETLSDIGSSFIAWHRVIIHCFPIQPYSSSTEITIILVIVHLIKDRFASSLFRPHKTASSRHNLTSRHD